ELQAEAIVMLQLYRLSTTDIQALRDEQETLLKEMDKLNQILSNEKILMKTIKNELLEVHAILGNDRKSVIEDEIEAIKIDHRELITEEKTIVGITKDGYVKRASLRSYQATSEPGLKENDAFIFEKEVNTLDTLLIFTNLGQYIFLPVYKIDEQKWKDLGVYINNIVPFEKQEVLIKVLVVSNSIQDEKVLMATRVGQMKQVNLSEFEVTRYNKPLRAMKLAEGDFVQSVDMGQKDQIIAMSQKGYGLRFDTDELPLYGLQAGGVKSMTLGDDDTLACAFYARSNDDFYFLTSRGHIIKDTVQELPKYARGRRGVIILERLKALPHLVVAGSRLSKAQVKEDVKVRIVGNKEAVYIPLSEIKYSPNKFGKKMIDDGYFLEIDKSSYEEEIIVVEKKKETKKQEQEAKVVEEAI